MAYEHSCVVERPIDDVFAWHGRPGALQRLLPPWLPGRVAREAGSLRDGHAVLALPGGLTWTATHQPDGFDPPRVFTDVVTGPFLGPVVGPALGWRHTHRFDEEPGGGTRVTDRVETRLPDRFLAEAFAYRGRQLGDDLASHQRWAPAGPRPLTVAVTGSSGLVGTALSSFLSSGGHQVIRLVRNRPAGTDRLWQPFAPDTDPGLLAGVDAVVHLAGRSIAGRFSEAHKGEVRASRVEPTRLLARTVADAGVPVLVAASAIGIYGPDRGDEELTEDSPRGDGFLAELVSDWEEATRPARQAGARVVTVRTGVVQSPKGGSLGVLRPLFELGLGGRLGDGRQWTSWIGIDDLVDVYLRALVDPALDGPVNAVAPAPVRNDEYTSTLARVLKRPAVLTIPPFGPELLLGREGAREVARASQRVVPARLAQLGHHYRHPDLEAALRHGLGRSQTT